MGPVARTMAVYAIAYLIAQSIVSPSLAASRVVGLVGFIPLSAVTAWIFFRARRASDHRASDHRDTRRAFGGYAISFALTALGTLVTAGSELRLGTETAYPWNNALYLASYPAAAFAVLSFRAHRPGPIVRWRLLIDTAIAVAAAVVMTWLYIIVPQIGTHTGMLDQVVLYAYPVGDLVLFAALVPMLLAPRHPQAGGILRLLATAQMTYLAADLIDQLSPPRIPGVPVDWPDVIYLTGYVGMIWAAEAFSRAPVPNLTGDGPVGAARPSRNWLPVALGGFVYLLLLTVALRPWTQPLGPLVLTAVFVTLLIMIRERLTERQTVQLARELDAERNAARFRDAIAHLKVGIAIIGPDGRVSVANPAAVRLLQLDGPIEGSALTRPGWELTTEDGQPIGPEGHPAALALATGRAVRDLVIGVQAPGGAPRRWLLVDADPRFDTGSGQVAEVIVSLHDITERRLLEQQLRHTQRMEAVGKLAGGIAHDFNNLLTAIIGHSDILKISLGPDDQRIEEVGGILQAADRAARLTGQLLALSRRQHLNPDVLDLNEVVRETGRLLVRLLGEDIAIVMDLDDNPIIVRVDRGQLEQVIVNLALNARDAMPRGGHLTVATRRLEDQDPERPPEFVGGEAGVAVLRVSDVGEGMDNQTRSRAFEPFFTTKEVGKGTGLGLATVYGIVQQSGGEVVIDSEPGLGTSVTVFLPATIGPPSAPPPQPTAAPTRPTRATPEQVILAVEDDAALREVIRRALMQRGYRVLVAGSPSTARAIIESSATIDLLLTDVVMPGGNGPELAAWARTLRPDLPVLLMTGHADDLVHRYNLGPAPTDMIQKPFDPADLAARIAASLGHQG